MNHNFHIFRRNLYDGDSLIVSIGWNINNTVYRYRGTKKGLKTRNIRDYWVIPIGDDYV